MPIHPRFLILFFVLAAGGCVSAHATLLTPHRYPAVPPEEVSVYLGADEVPAGCERIVLIHMAGDANWTNEQQLIRAARKRAGRSGANAVALRSLRDPGLGTRVVAEIFDLPAERKGEMLGFRCPPPAAPDDQRATG
jgi:hypothetical protein